MPTKPNGRLRAGRTFTVLVGLLALIAIGILTFNVVNQINAQSSAQSDNVQWSLSQAEVEFQEFNARLRLGSDLPSVRRRFDIFYSRVQTVRDAKVFEALRNSDEFDSHLKQIEIFLDDAVDLIDVDDVQLTQNFPILGSMARDIRPDVRSLSNSGLKLFARQGDRQRGEVAQTMTRLAIALAVLISALGFSVLYLSSLNQTIIRREREQEQIAARIKTIMSTSLDGVIVSNSEGIITDFNNAAEQIFGHRAENVLGKELGKIIIPDHLRPLHDAGMERMRRGGEQRVVGKGRVQLEAKRSDNTVFPVELAIQSATTESGDIYIAFLRDVSQRVADETELIDARDKAIAGEQSRSEFLATMSHEIRTPLNGLLGNMILMQDTNLSAKQETYLQNMETSGRLLMGHVSDVLDIARYDSGKISLRAEPFNVSDLLQDIVDSQSGMALAQSTNLVWGWSGPPQHSINGDPERLQHVLMNLIGNAVKFTKDGRVSVVATWEHDRIDFIIEDTGIGIKDDMIDHIFDDFVTGNTSYDREASGTGLGLSIVKRFVEAQNGNIDVHSVFGEGTMFTVSIPATAAEPVHINKRVAETVPSIAAQKILVVEDNEINRFVVRNMLEGDGHTVVEAFDGNEGVQAAYETRFDLILMDISMPVLDGRTATLQIREGRGASAKTRIVALTASALPEERKDFLAHGMDGVLTKPLTKKSLRGILEPPKEDPTPADQSVIDLAQNIEIHSVLGSDGYAKMHAKFDQEVKELCQWLASGPDLASLVDRAHKVAGSSGMFGATSLREALLDLEIMAKNKNEVGIAEALPDVLALGENTRKSLKQLALTDQK